MQIVRLLASSQKLYAASALASLIWLLLTIVHIGSDGPFGPTLDQVVSGDVTTDPDQNAFEIVYFGDLGCQKCAVWRKSHLPIWRQAALSREVRLTMRSSSCGTANKYASLCRDLVRGSNDQPVFALIHWDTGRVLATGSGVTGFYSVGQTGAEVARKCVGPTAHGVTNGNCARDECSAGSNQKSNPK